jgi:hypothetical protein
MLSNIELYNEIKIFIEYFIEAFFIVIIIQIISDKIDNNNINILKELKVSFFIACILYIAKSINSDCVTNVKQGLHYAISGVFLSQYAL